MQRLLGWSLLAFVTYLPTAGRAVAAEPPPKPEVEGILPVDSRGKPLNLDFEAGTLADWDAEGDAFKGQPIAGDAVAARRSDMKSRHQGRFWVGGYERGGDPAQGTLTSRPFRVTHPYARFLVGAGSTDATRVEVVRRDNREVLARASGDDTEDLRPVVVDLSKQQGREIFIRLVDRSSAGWGHLNFDDFRFFATRPAVPTRPAVAAADVFMHEGLSPLEAARAMTVPEGFRVTLFAGEPDVVQPIAQAIDDRGRLWVAEAYSYPNHVPEAMAKDRILIFEDKDGDGRFDDRRVFADRLNLVSGLEIGFGGVWVGAAPNLLFIPDRNRDDTPDGPPQVVLDGWGFHDTHETLNSFTWGPDGWLYGCHGVFTHSRVGAPGTPDDCRTPINAGIWRLHPVSKAFEVFAHGTSNPWGVDFDENGQAFLTSCVIPHLYHVIQGARYERQAGPHFNPYTYDDIKTIADHRHYLGANPHAGNGRSDGAGGGHAHAGALIYNGGKWPAEYAGSIFMNNIHGARINRDLLIPEGSGFVGKHAPDFLKANDRWSQVISLKSGPDGNVYLIDWYDKNQCHRREDEVHDRTNGRIFKVSVGADVPDRVDLNAHTDLELVKFQRHPNNWFARHARRILQERGAVPEGAGALRAMLASGTTVERLRALWALHAIHAHDSATRTACLADSSPDVRAWTIRLALEDPSSRGDSQFLAKLAALSRDDPSPIVRLALASSLQRIPPASRWDLLEGLCRHAEDVADHNLPLMIWYGAEPLAEVDSRRLLAVALAGRIPLIASYSARRIASLGTAVAVAELVDALGSATDSASRMTVLQGLNDAFKGRRRVEMPGAWPRVARGLGNDRDPNVVAEARRLGLTFGDPTAMEALRRILSDAKGPLDRRQTALADLLRVHDPDLSPELLSLLDDQALRGQALRALAAYDEPRIATRILELYARLPRNDRRDALNTLATRHDSAKALLRAIEAGRLPASDLTAEIVRQLRNFKDGEIVAALAKVWGQVNETSEAKARQIALTKGMLRSPATEKPDPTLGRALFARTCQQCHVLFGIGGKVGPELTGSNRADLDYLLSNILDPSALIGKDYQAQVIATRDGRVLTGLIRAEDRDAITLVSANDIVTIPKGEVEDRKPSDRSMMPDDLLKNLGPLEIRSLIAYLASPAQVPMLATAENVAGFFNGRDLDGWAGDPRLWSVEGGELVGRTVGLKRNEFLRSDLLLGDFHLTLEVKLVANRGNSGIQFRSESLPDGEVRGYQADVGEGWWGKLYEENGRGLLWSQSGEAFVKPGEWNRYEVVAIGHSIATSLNGRKCVDLDDRPGALRGIVAFQLHSGGPTEVRFRKIRLRLGDRAGLTPRPRPEAMQRSGAPGTAPRLMDGTTPGNRCRSPIGLHD